MSEPPEICNNPFFCILEKSYPALYKSLSSDNTILLPTSQSLININIDKSFIEKHIFNKLDVANNYVNSDGQIVELVKNKFLMSYGFTNSNILNIVSQLTVNNGASDVRVFLVDSHLLVCNNSNELINPNTANEDVEWYSDNAEFKHFFTNALARLRKTFVLMPGYEAETANIIANVVDKAVGVAKAQTLILLNKKSFNAGYKRRLFEIGLNYAFAFLHELLWTYLQNSYASKEEIVQNRILKLRNELNLNLSLLIFDNRREVDKINILPTVELLKQMEKNTVPLKKLEHLNNAIMRNNTNNAQEEAVSFIILAIVVGGLRNVIANYVYLDMYAQSLGTGSKSLKIYNSAISFLLE